METTIKKCYQFNKDDEWYTPKEYILDFIEKVKIPKDKVIWCPFDTAESNFVKCFQNAGYKVVYSHIDLNQDFFETLPNTKFDVIVSNPPFSNKQKTLNRLIEINKPFALLFGIQCFNSGNFVAGMNKLKKPQFIFMSKRVVFTKDLNNYDLKKLPRPSFHTLWFCNDLLNKDINIWE